MSYKNLNYTWCEDCIGCSQLEIDKFPGVYKTKEKPTCFEDGYTQAEKVKKLREKKDLNVYGSMHGNNN